MVSYSIEGLECLSFSVVYRKTVIRPSANAMSTEKLKKKELKSLKEEVRVTHMIR